MLELQKKTEQFDCNNFEINKVCQDVAKMNTNLSKAEDELVEVRQLVVQLKTDFMKTQDVVTQVSDQMAERTTSSTVHAEQAHSEVQKKVEELTAKIDRKMEDLSTHQKDLA